MSKNYKQEFIEIKENFKGDISSEYDISIMKRVSIKHRVSRVKYFDGIIDTYDITIVRPEDSGIDKPIDLDIVLFKRFLDLLKIEEYNEEEDVVLGIHSVPGICTKVNKTVIILKFN